MEIESGRQPVAASSVLLKVRIAPSRPISKSERNSAPFWSPADGNEREYLRVVINQLRKKLEGDPGHPA
jgi:hypothetical protein